MELGQIVRRTFVYVGLAVASLAILSLVFALSICTHISVPFQWVMLAVFAGVLFFAIVKTDREYWNRPAFWFLCTAALTVHFGIFVPVLRGYPDFKAIWWVPIVIVEASIFSVIFEMLLIRRRR